MIGSSRTGGLRLALLLSLLATAVPASAAVEVGASLDRETIRVGEQAVLTVTVNGEARTVGNPKLPEVPDCEIFGGGQSQRMSFVNGQVSASHTFTYYLRPRKEGKFRMAPIEIEVDGSVFKTPPLDLTIVAGSAPSQPAPNAAPPATGTVPDARDDYFVTMRADKDSVVVGEQIVLTFAFYRATGSSFFDSPQYTPPATEGFWREALPPDRQTSQVIRSRRFNVTEISYALFPTRAGQLEIGEAVVRIPNDTFGTLLRRRNRRRNDEFLRTEPIAITVRPLPAGAPTGFGGTVGQGLKLDASVDRTRVAVGDALTLAISLEGDGYLAAAQRPEFNLLSGFRVHDDGNSIDSGPANGRMRGRLTLSKLLIPTEAGTHRIGPIEYVYYDTERDEYVSLKSRELAVNVTPSDAAVSPVFTGSARSEIEVLGQDILHIKPITGALRPYTGPLARRGVFWLGLLVPSLAWMVSMVLAKRRDRLLADPARRRASRALRQATTALKEEGVPQARVDAALRGYVGDKSGRSAAGLSRPEILEILQHGGVSSELAERVVELLDRCDHLRFAGAQSGGDELTGEAHALLGALEKEW